MSAAKQKGTRAETAVVGYLQAFFPYVERRALRGSKDQGDIAGIPGVVIEVKDRQKMELAAWVDQAQEALGGLPDLAVVWHKRQRKTFPGDWYVTMTGAQFVALLKETRR